MVVTESLVKTRIHGIEYASEDALIFDLRSPNGEELPGFTAGAHLDVHMPAGLTRSYSLFNDSSERDRYLICVKREPKSRGGSAWMHETARVGSMIEVSAPRNNFALAEEAPHTVLIAGGIGITPMWSMAQRLEELGNSWSLYYRARSQTCAPLLHLVRQGWLSERIHLNFSDQKNHPRLNLDQVVREAPEGTHFYCCGPASMIDAFERACCELSSDLVHVEHFSSTQEAATDGGFVVRLLRTGLEIQVEPGQTILDSLKAAGVTTPSSCQQGVCGACETRVVAGRPDHRDLVLSEQEKVAGKTMMICCSGSLSRELVLDL